MSLAAITEYSGLSDFNSKHLFLISKIKVPTHVVPGEDPFPGL